jgi:hypothetical protein
MMRRLVPLAVAAAALLVACSPDGSDFKHETEQFLKGDERVVAEIGTTFTEAECQSPQETAVGASYQCVAVAADGSTWDFAVQIIEKNRFRIVDYNVRA